MSEKITIKLSDSAQAVVEKSRMKKAVDAWRRDGGKIVVTPMAKP